MHDKFSNQEKVASEPSVEKQEMEKPERIDLQLSGQKFVIFDEDSLREEGHANDEYVDLLANILYEGETKLTTLSSDDRQKIVTLLGKMLKGAIEWNESQIKKKTMWSIGFAYGVSPNFIRLAYDLGDSSLIDLAKEILSRNTSGYIIDNLSDDFLEKHHIPFDKRRWQEDVVENAPTKEVKNIKETATEKSINAPVTENIREKRKMYDRMLQQYAEKLKEMRKLEASSSRPGIREFLGKEEMLPPQEILKKDRERDALHKKMLLVAHGLGLTSEDVWADILKTTDGTLAEMGLPELIIQREKAAEEHSAKIIFGVGGTSIAGSGYEAAIYKFKDKIADATFIVDRSSWKDKIEPFSRAIQFQKYLVEKYPKIFQLLSEEDIDAHGKEICEGVKIQTNQIHKAASIIREEMEKFKS